jgi:hypothetical protein
VTTVYSDKGRCGHRRTLETTDLIVWIRKNSTQPIMISLSPKGD